MKKTLLALGLFSLLAAQAQNTTPDESWKSVYRATPEKTNDLVHTKLQAGFDYDKSQLKGKVWLTLRPHFYATDSLHLDAKGMDIHSVAIVSNNNNQPLKYTYKNDVIHINLNKTYTRAESYTVYIEYTAKPNEYKAKGSAAITDAKGMYFINPKGTEKDKPTQIWTQGETEATSVWVPTIDKPNQKTTQEFYLTVPAKYVTLSNGLLISQKQNGNGTRTDYWKMDQPHAPYLFFIGVGDYAVVKDSYKGKEVSYYVEKPYEKVARKIFGYTPEMMKLFSDKLGVEYPWAKYAQITGVDYVSGAMENTTATLHGAGAQQDARELLDGNSWEETIAHELFHQWFGDLVTTESWSNLTVNESFANYSEVIWAEYKHGKDEGDFINMRDMNGYIQSGSEDKHLVRFHYADKEDMFDAVSYNKGGRILHMLRNYVGDDAFFKSLNNYLTTNKFKTGEAHQLRLAFEETTGKDLNWFFNQWYFSNGHPKLDIKYSYNADNKQALVVVKQTQANKVYTLPTSIDVYYGNKRERHQVWVDSKEDTFYINANTKPDLIQFDGDRVLLAERKDNKSLQEHLHAFRNTGKYLDRREALDAAAKNLSKPEALAFIVNEGLKDPFFRIRLRAITSLGMGKPDASAVAVLEKIALQDPQRIVRAQAIDALAKLKNPAYADMFKKAAQDSSYSVAGAGLVALLDVDSAAAVNLAKQLGKSPAKGRLASAITDISIKSGDESAFESIAAGYENMGMSQEKFQQTASFAQFLAKVNDTAKFKKGVDLIVGFKESIPESFRAQTNAYFNNILTGLMNAKKAAGANDLAEYIKSKMGQ